MRWMKNPIETYSYYFNMNDHLLIHVNDLYDAMREHLGSHVKYTGEWAPIPKPTLNRIGKK